MTKIIVAHHRHGATDIAPLTYQSAAHHTPAAGSHRALCTGEPLLAASQQASPCFCIDVSQHRVVEHLFSQELLQRKRCFSQELLQRKRCFSL